MCCTVCQRELQVGEEMTVHEGKPYCAEHYTEAFTSKCPGCHKNIVEGNVITIGDYDWHLECVVCATCDRPIGDEEVFEDHAEDPEATGVNRQQV